MKPPIEYRKTEGVPRPASVGSDGTPVPGRSGTRPKKEPGSTPSAVGMASHTVADGVPAGTLAEGESGFGSEAAEELERLRAAQRVRSKRHREKVKEKLQRLRDLETKKEG